MTRASTCWPPPQDARGLACVGLTCTLDLTTRTCRRQAGHRNLWLARHCLLRAYAGQALPLVARGFRSRPTLRLIKSPCRHLTAATPSATPTER